MGVLSLISALTLSFIESGHLNTEGGVNVATKGLQISGKAGLKTPFILTFLPFSVVVSPSLHHSLASSFISRVGVVLDAMQTYRVSQLALVFGQSEQSAVSLLSPVSFRAPRRRESREQEECGVKDDAEVQCSLGSFSQLKDSQSIKEKKERWITL